MQHEEMHGKDPWMSHKSYRAIRALTAVIVLIFVFWCGFQLGEIRSMVQQPYPYGYGGAMMRFGWTDASGQSASTQSSGPMIPVGGRVPTTSGTGIVN